jgi:hypothetical protein
MNDAKCTASSVQRVLAGDRSMCSLCRTRLDFEQVEKVYTLLALFGSSVSQHSLIA